MAVDMEMEVGVEVEAHALVIHFARRPDVVLVGGCFVAVVVSHSPNPRTGIAKPSTWSGLFGHGEPSWPAESRLKDDHLYLCNR